MKIYKEEITDLMGQKWKVVYYDPKQLKPEQMPQRLKDLLQKGYEVALYKEEKEPIPGGEDYKEAVREAFVKDPDFIFLQEDASDYVKECIKNG